MNNNIKMIKTDPYTIDLLSKIKGWYLLRENNFSYAHIVKNLVLKEAKRKGLVDGDGDERNSESSK